MHSEKYKQVNMYFFLKNISELYFIVIAKVPLKKQGM